jgi:hypothetical protein
MVAIDRSELAPPGPLSLFRCNLAEPEPPGPRLSLISSAEFDSTQYRRDWLVEGVLVEGQPVVLGGPKKSLKTTMLVELGVALSIPAAFGPGRFLGRFAVPRPRRVAIFSGESGEHTLQETARRVARSRGLDLARLQIHWGFTLPRVTVESDLQEIRGLVERHGFEVVIIDPLYLSLLGGGSEIDTKNLFSMGPALLEFARACLDHGCTPILAHHTRKRGDRNEYRPLDLDDLSYSGISEFARQWFLVNRRSPYREGSGQHELWVRFGGSAGHSGYYGVDVDEGVPDLRFLGRTWDVRVSDPDEVLLADKQAKRSASREKGQQERAERAAREMEEALRVFQSRSPEPMSLADFKRTTGWNNDKAKGVVHRLLDQGVLKGLGKATAGNHRAVQVYGLAQPTARA